MRKIITIGREFGSGGRELGRRIAEKLRIEFYDKEIISQISERTPFTEQYLEEIENHVPHILYPITVAKTFFNISDYAVQQAQTMFSRQSHLLHELAEKSDCVIVGRCADYVLQNYNPYRIFVYSDMESKIRRCRERETRYPVLSDNEIKQNILKIDKARSKYYSFHSEQEWGNKKNYDLCINTANVSIKDFAEVIAELF